MLQLLIKFDIAYAVYFGVLTILLLIWAIKEDGEPPLPLFITHLISLGGTIILSFANVIIVLVLRS